MLKDGLEKLSSNHPGLSLVFTLAAYVIQENCQFAKECWEDLWNPDGWPSYDKVDLLEIRDASPKIEGDIITIAGIKGLARESLKKGDFFQYRDGDARHIYGWYLFQVKNAPADHNGTIIAEFAHRKLKTEIPRWANVTTKFQDLHHASTVAFEDSKLAVPQHV